MIKTSKTVYKTQNDVNDLNSKDISPNRIDLKINNNSLANYSLSANSIKLMPKIEEFNNYIKLTTIVNSNFVKGDIVYISALSGDTGVEYTDETYVMDNIIEVSGCTDWYYHPYMLGYEIIDLDEKKNQIIINRKYESKFDNKELINHYITKIYVDNQYITGGYIDGVIYKNALMNITGDTIDITLDQCIILSGITNFVDFNDKFDQNYSSLNTSLDYSNYISKNNEKFGYTIVKNLKISGSTIDNGYFYNCEINDSVINNGYFYNCIVDGGTINNGNFSLSTIETTVNWEYGIWNGGVFNPLIWKDGVWNSGVFESLPPDKQKIWKKGIFNGGSFITAEGVLPDYKTTWENGYFNNGIFSNSIWENGTFTKSTFIESEWHNGSFNGNIIIDSNWYNGNFYSGELISSTWQNGNFYNGTISENTTWQNGNFYNGSFNKSTWQNGIFYNGIIEDSEWQNGIFNNGIMLKCNWSDGIFNDGIMNGLNSGLTYSRNTIIEFSNVWQNGVFNGGKMDNMYWIKGTFNNGIVSNSVMVAVDWNDGIFNGNVIGPYAYDLGDDLYNLKDDVKFFSENEIKVKWKRGIFNNGKFGLPTEDMYGVKMGSYWSGGTFNYGEFYNFTGTTDITDSSGGFYGGEFLNGNFYGIFYGGSFVSGNFMGVWNSYKLPPRFIKKTNIKPVDLIL